MTKKSQLKKRIATLKEIHSILSALKNLSLIEIKKMSQFRPAQEAARKILEEALTDFLSYYPLPLPQSGAEGGPLYLLIGSERGFCAGFNDAVMEKFFSLIKREKVSASPQLILVGEKLMAKMEAHEGVFQSLVGPTAREEVEEVILMVLESLRAFQKKSFVFNPRLLTVIANQESDKGWKTQFFRPFERFYRNEKKSFSFPPLLNLSAQQLFPLFYEHYLFSILHHLFYSSLVAEHRQRVGQLSQAVNHLEKKNHELNLHFNTLRQEAITEEIEVILLGTQLLSERTL